MRENRTYGSEGGEAKAFPTPIVALPRATPISEERWKSLSETPEGLLRDSTSSVVFWFRATRCRGDGLRASAGPRLRPTELPSGEGA
jgi:hypothetical protein